MCTTEVNFKDTLVYDVSFYINIKDLGDVCEETNCRNNMSFI